jgi:hypothetical protein
MLSVIDQTELMFDLCMSGIVPIEGVFGFTQTF